MSAQGASPVPGTSAPRSLGRARPRYGELVITALLFVAAAISVATTVGIVFALLPPTIEFFERVTFAEFFTGTNWFPLFDPPSYGVLPIISGTLMLTAIGVLVAVPLGLLTAIYLSEYARSGVRKTVKPILEILAGIPTVVYGFFALYAFTPLLRDYLPWEIDGKNGIAAGVFIGVMIIPTVASLSEDAMSAVPTGLREGGYALGSSRMAVALRVVVPAALSGIVAACILGVSRAIGETMIALIAFGLLPNFTWNPSEQGMTMAGFIANAGQGDVSTASFDYKTIFAVGSVLFVMTFVLNLISIRLVRRFREVYE